MSGWCSGQHSCISFKQPGFNSPHRPTYFNFPFSQSHPSGVTKPSSLKLATSGLESSLLQLLRRESHIKGFHKSLPVITGPYPSPSIKANDGKNSQVFLLNHITL